MDTKGLYPFMYRGIAGDINMSTKNGYYEARADYTSNFPPNAYTYGILEVFGGNLFLAQRYTPHSKYSGLSYGEFSRVMYNGEWTEWRFIPYQ